MNKKDKLSRQQYYGLAIIAAMVVCVMLFVHLVPPQRRATPTPLLSAEPAVQDSVPTPVDPPIQRHVFDPNTADSITLTQQGLQPWQASNILRYRAKNGRYRQPEDMLKLYGMTDSLYQLIEPYIDIDTAALRREREARYPKREPTRDTVRHADTLHYKPRVEKRDTLIDLNHTDSVELQKIRFVGPYTAKRIIWYGQQLGGYASAEQIREIEGLDSTRLDSILLHLTASPEDVTPIRVNTASVSLLFRHPYISSTQAKAIYDHRRRRFSLGSIDELSTLDCLTEADLLRLAPYLDFTIPQSSRRKR